MADQLEIKKAKTHKGRLHLETKLPKLIEVPKECLYLNTHNSSELMRMVLNDLVKNFLFNFTSIYYEKSIQKNFPKKTKSNLYSKKRRN